MVNQGESAPSPEQKNNTYYQMSTTTQITCDWTGKSGKKYKYYVHPLGANFKDEGGNYIFCKKNPQGRWTPQYVGQTNSLKDRLGHHEKEACAKRNGATHIHAHLNSTESSRLVEEKDLVTNYKPTCNEQLVG